MLDASVERNLATWRRRRRAISKGGSIERDQIAGLPLARLTVGDGERWHTRLHKAGMADVGLKNQHGLLHASLAQAMRWG